jgi:hypothetical protein
MSTLHFSRDLVEAQMLRRISIWRSPSLVMKSSTCSGMPVQISRSERVDTAHGGDKTQWQHWSWPNLHLMNRRTMDWNLETKRQASRLLTRAGRVMCPQMRMYARLNGVHGLFVHAYTHMPGFCFWMWIERGCRMCIPCTAHGHTQQGRVGDGLLHSGDT